MRNWRCYMAPFCKKQNKVSVALYYAILSLKVIWRTTFYTTVLYRCRGETFWVESSVYLFCCALSLPTLLYLDKNGFFSSQRNSQRRKQLEGALSVQPVKNVEGTQGTRLQQMINVQVVGVDFGGNTILWNTWTEYDKVGGFCRFPLVHDAGLVSRHHVLDVDVSVPAPMPLQNFQCLLNEVAQVLPPLLRVVNLVPRVY